MRDPLRGGPGGAMNVWRVAALAGAILAVSVTAACSGPVYYVFPAGSPVVSDCQQVQLMSLPVLDVDIDTANVDPGGSDEEPGIPALSAAALADVAKYSATLYNLGEDLPADSPAETAFKNAMTDLGSVFEAVSLAPAGETDNQQATAADSDTATITGFCSAVRVGS